MTRLDRDPKTEIGVACGLDPQGTALSICDLDSIDLFPQTMKRRRFICPLPYKHCSASRPNALSRFLNSLMKVSIVTEFQAIVRL